MKNLVVGKKNVVYRETPPAGSYGGYRHFDVTVDGKAYELAANENWQVADTTDHPILRDHKDVVEAIVSEERKG